MGFPIFGERLGKRLRFIACVGFGVSKGSLNPKSHLYGSVRASGFEDFWAYGMPKLRP